MFQISYSKRTPYLLLLFISLFLTQAIYAKTVVTDNGTSVHSGAVNCNGAQGTVRVSLGVKWDDVKEIFSLDDEGQIQVQIGQVLSSFTDGIYMRIDQDDCHWIQFVKVTIVEKLRSGQENKRTI